MPIATFLTLGKIRTQFALIDHSNVFAATQISPGPRSKMEEFTLTFPQLRCDEATVTPSTSEQGTFSKSRRVKLTSASEQILLNATKGGLDIKSAFPVSASTVKENVGSWATLLLFLFPDLYKERNVAAMSARFPR